MTNNEKLILIENTIKEVKGDFPPTRLIQDCADKLSLDYSEVKQILINSDSELIKNQIDI